MYDFLEAVITSQTSKEEAYRKLEDMAKNQTETLSKLTKQVSTSHLSTLYTQTL
jgi:tetratricopeptide repeat protein 30